MAILLQKKSDKIDNFKQQKILENEKNNMNKEILNNKRREFELQFKPIFHDKKIDKYLTEKITEFFPNNNELINIVEKIKKLEHEEQMEKMKKRAKSNKLYEIKYGNKNKNLIRSKTPERKKVQNNYIKPNINFISTINQKRKYNYQFNNYNNNSNNKTYSSQNNFNKVDDKEILILDKLNEYKIKLNKELTEAIELEAKKEEERIKMYNNMPINKKEQTKIIIQEERKKSNDLIKNLLENNEKKAKEYEYELRKMLI